MAATVRAFQVGPEPMAWKHAPPCPPELLLAREHLVRKIEQLLGDRHTGAGAVSCVVVAPAGYGKTTLLGQWAMQTGLQVAWYHLDAADNDPVTCLWGILRALKFKMPTGAWEIERFLGHLRSGTLEPDALRRAAAILSGDLQRNVKKPIALVLTGLSDLSPQEAGSELIDALLARPLDKMRLVLESREYPQFHVASLLAQRRLVGLSVDDLRLRAEEFRELISRAQVDIDAQQIAQIEDLCAGWITGVLLATGALLPSFLRLASCEQFDHERVLEYLAREVIDRLPLADRVFAVHAAVLTSMTPPLCAELLDIADARERLVALERRTGFVTRVGRQTESAVYRFQPFLRQALLAELETAPGGSALRRTLHERAGDLLRERAAFDEAAHHYAQAGRYDALVSMIEARRSLLLRAGQGMTLARWIQLLPNAERARWPELEVLLAHLHRLAGNMDEARAVARAASHLMAQADSHPDLAARLAVVLGNIAFQEGDNRQAADLSAQALQLAPEHAVDIALSAGSLGVSATLAREGPARALAKLDEVRSRCAGMRDPWQLAALHYLHSKIHYLRGAYDEAETAAAAALQRAQEAGDEVTAVNARLNLGAIASRRNAAQQAWAQFEAAQAQSVTAGYARGQAYASVNLADLSMYGGDYEGAVAAYQEAWSCVEATGEVYLRCCMVSNLACSLVMLGRTQEAVRLLEKEVSAFGSRAHDLNWIDLAIALGFAYHRSGCSAQARLLLDEAHACAAALDATLKVGRARLCRAAVELKVNRPTAVSEMHAAFDALMPLGPGAIRLELRQLVELHPLLDELRHPLADMLRSPDADGTPATDSAADACTGKAIASRAAPITLAGMLPELPEVRLFTLGEPRVFVGTTQIKHWRKPGVRDLLFFLAERGSATTDQVLAALWPDTPTDRSLAAFREVRSRLKTALGLEECLIRENGRWRLAMKIVVDAQEFESLLDAGERCIQENDLVSAATALRQAMTFWSGPYLDDVYSEWVMPRREALLRRYHDGLERLGEVEVRLGRLDDAIQHFYLLLDADRYRESSYRGLIRCFAMRGEIGKALDQYDLCLRMLGDLNAAPSRETVQLAHHLRARVNALDSSRDLQAVRVS